MNRDSWNARYGGRELVWSADPNRFVAEAVGSWPPGRAIDVACGEGRNAIWLAGLGWQVTAVDFADVGLTKGRQLAEAAGVTVDWICADVTAYRPEPGAFDLVLLCYLHLPGPEMATVLSAASAALAPGGAVVVVAHALANLTNGVGGPQDPAVLYEPADVVGWLPGLAVERAEQVLRDVEPEHGGGPTGKAGIDLVVVARRPR